MSILNDINNMQDTMGRKRISEIPNTWKIFAEYEGDKCKGIVILYEYKRLTCEPDYMTGKIAEIEIFTFPEYRRTGVSTRLIKQAIQYARENKIDVVADCKPAGYAVLKTLGFEESTDKRVWLRLSDS